MDVSRLHRTAPITTGSRDTEAAPASSRGTAQPVHQHSSLGRTAEPHSACLTALLCTPLGPHPAVSPRSHPLQAGRSAHAAAAVWPRGPPLAARSVARSRAGRWSGTAAEPAHAAPATPERARRSLPRRASYRLRAAAAHAARRGCGGYRYGTRDEQNKTLESF